MAKKKSARRKTPKRGKQVGRRTGPARQPGPAPASGGEAAEAGLPIVGIGASAGGLAAFKKFFAAMPSEPGMAFVLIPHLDPTHESLMVDLLSTQTTMPVVEAEHGMTVEANCVYIIPPNKYLAIADRALQLSPPPQPRGLQTAIDFFLRSLAEDQQERAIGIVLSGTGSHGTSGIREIKLVGGMVMAQEPESAEYDQMPRSAIAAGVVDFVLPPELMPETLVTYVQHPYLNRDGTALSPPEQAAAQFDRVLAVLRTRAKHDFRSYRKNMLMRRVLRRMGLSHTEQLSEYLELLRNNPDEVTALSKDMLIGVTAFFREAEAFQILEKQVIPELVERTTNEQAVRVWVPACATGEEAYSVAMLLIEAFAAADKPLNIQIFASDIDDASLDVARNGTYAASIAGDVSLERLKRFFVKTDETHYQVNKQLRESVVFARQNLIGDAPFSKLNLISCRNLLIYLEPDVQQKVIALFHFALVEGGSLLLGPSESIGRAIELFEPVSKKWRVYRRIGPVRRELVEIPIVTTDRRRREGGGATQESAPVSRVAFKDLTERLILSDYAPAAALINRKHEILYVSGPLVNYLEFPAGELTRDLLAMARQGLRTKIRAACHQAVRTGQSVTDSDARVQRNGSYVRCRLTVRPLDEPKEAEGLMLVTFQDHETPPLPRPPGTAPAQLALDRDESAEFKIVQQLEYELKSTREDLQSSVEEIESSNEELKAANEEVMSMNEELQSANEELETSKEELQSLNEELSTVNNQLQDKVDDLDKAHNDLTNLMANSEIATLFLDTQFRIVRFTPPTAKLLNLVGTDMGRPIRDFAPRFNDDTMLEECRQVLDKLVVVERELRSDDDHYYLRRILPYRTADNHIDGVIVTFVDITERVKAEAESRRLATAVRDSNDAVSAHTLDGSIIIWNRGAERMYGYAEAEALQMNVLDLVPADQREETRKAIQRIADGQQESALLDVQRVTKDGRTLDVWLTISRLIDEAGQVVAVAATERDVTQLRVAAAELRLFNETLEQRVAAKTTEVRLLAEAVSRLGEGVTITGNDLEWPGPKIVFVNDAMCRISGYAKDELLGQTPRIRQGSGTERETLDRIRAELSANRSCLVELTNHRKDGTPYDAELFITPLFDADGKRSNFVSIHRDITQRKQTEEALMESEAQTRAILAALTAHIAVVDRSGTIVAVNPAWERFARENQGLAERCNVGANYLEVCDDARGLYSDEAPQIAAGLRDVLAGRRAEFSCEYPCHSEAEQRWFLLQVTPLENARGIVVSHLNVSDRIQAEEARRREHEFSESLTNTAQNIILVLDPAGRIVRFNPYLEALTGWRLDEVQGRDWYETFFLPERDRQRIRALFDASLGGQQTRGNVNTIVTKDGREREIEWYDAALTDRDGCFVGLLCTGLDVTERRILEREILEIAGDEQRRIGQELHDSTQQQLTGLALLAQNVATGLGNLKAEEAPTPLRERIAALHQRSTQIQEGLRDAAWEVSHLARGLVPVEVDAQGLMSSLTELAHSVDETGQLACTFECVGAIEVADNFTATHLFRIAQEAVNNALKHAQADRIEVSLARRHERITLRVLDNGQGMKDKQLKSPGMGLRIMGYRAELIGGLLTIDQAEGGGTQVTCSVPQG